MRSLSRAEQLLQSLGITDPSEIDLEAIAWDQGAEIKYRKLDGCEARIIGVGKKAIISIDSEANDRRKRFSIGHELGHWCYDRGKSFICRKEDIGNNSVENNPYDPEIIADKYSADLLLPLYIFNNIANQYEKVTFNTIGSIADVFNVSMTATAIRYAMSAPAPCILICYDKTGRKWFKRHPDVPDRLFPNDSLDRESGAFDVLFGDKEKTRPSIIGGDAWFNWHSADRYEVYEETIKILNGQILTLLTWKNEEMLEKATFS